MVRRQTTGLGLSEDEAFIGLVDYGLFSEKLPPCFTSKGLSDHVPNVPNILLLTKEDDPKELDNILKKRKHDFIRYEPLREVNIPRQMGVPHPESHIVQCLALNRHWATIKGHCAKPKTPVSRLFVRKTSSERVFQMNYEGEERFDNEEADIGKMTGAHYVARTDISNCFPSIYTHSIPWALHGRSKSKKCRSVLLAGNLLDKATQGIRDGQTNGLLIGPHSSNVVSEIILTRIDYEMTKKGYERFSRYIDDYTFYAKTYDEAEKFILDFIEHLLVIGIQRIYSDAIAHALYYSLKHNLQLSTLEDKFIEVIAIDDCLSDVLLLKYAKRYRIKRIREAIRRRANKLKDMETQEKDRFWLLIYQVWREETLRGEGQAFLAELKRNRFSFISFR